ncbi:HAD-IIB family hydrolase [Candidatus Kaiserbacteria bacterium]|nr:HAD-IIB family hydrolase [Candidatus Kaiserbacteria bacterium]
MMPKLAIFDLDGTLAESKQALTDEMAGLLTRLLAETKVAVISGGAFHQFLKQVVVRLPSEANLANLYILPTSGAALFEYDPSTLLRAGDSEWKKVYEERLSEKESHSIEEAMRAAARKTGVIDFLKPAWGERIEYRGGQVSLSALGQHAPLDVKKEWDPTHVKRRKLEEELAAQLPEFSVGIGGATTIDVTKRGVDKAYGIHKLCERLGIDESDALYVGDELEAGGNDEAVYKTSVQIKAVASPAETVEFIESIISNT